ncbi:MAG: L-2-hydroxyglutarate oxidase [Rickettsiales bacterium]|nr:L-2-hydroxyglutarate oxidase [Rickettsiales bacterium]
MTPSRECDFLIIGAGIIGLSLAHELRQRYPQASIMVVDKERDVAAHASGRNSGVLHAGFYYSADSLKAKFCRDGNVLMKEYAQRKGLILNRCGKVVVAQNEREQGMVHELARRANVNGVAVEVVDEARLAEIEPNAKTHKEALYSPTTATVDPLAVCHSLASDLKEQGVALLLGQRYERRLDGNKVSISGGAIRAGKIINCAGLYADRIAKDFGFGAHFTIIPLKGVYINYTGADIPIRTCIYPVPVPGSTSLGVHYGIRADGTIRIGPTAIPAFWRENYQALSRFSASEAAAIMAWEAKLLVTNQNGFRELAWSEIKKYWQPHMAAEAAKLVKHIDTRYFNQWSRPGIRAQLLDKRDLTMVQDFVVESDSHSAHVLNAVSPAFTSSFAFSRWLIDTHI